MSDRIAVMNDGVVEQVAEPEQVYDRPATTFVAGFIGVSNLMPGRVTKAGDRGEVELDAGVRVHASVNGFGEGELCHAVVRPEKLRIRLVEEGADTELPNVEGIVESSLYLGTATQIVVRLPDKVAMTVLVANTDEDERRRLPGGGAKVRLSWAPEHMHLVRESGGGGENRERSQDLAPLAIAVALLMGVVVLAALWRRRRRWWEQRRRSGREVRTGPGQAHDLELAGIHRPGIQGHRGRVREGNRRRGQVHRGHHQQHRVLRQAAAAARPRRFRRSRHLRGHRLDGEADVRPRLPAGGRPRRPANRVRQHPSPVRGGPRRPGAQVHDPVAGRPDRASGSTRRKLRRSSRSRTCSIPSTRAR